MDLRFLRYLRSILPRYEQMPWKRVRQVDGVLELCRIVKEAHPERLVGAGGNQHDNNR